MAISNFDPKFVFSTPKNFQVTSFSKIGYDIKFLEILGSHNRSPFWIFQFRPQIRIQRLKKFLSTNFSRNPSLYGIFWKFGYPYLIRHFEFFSFNRKFVFSASKNLLIPRFMEIYQYIECFEILSSHIGSVVSNFDSKFFYGKPRYNLNIENSE